MKKFWSAVPLFVFLFAGNLFGQSSNASVGGFVQDPSQAFIPGVTVTATNTQTGIVSSTVTNESGTYTISSLLPGTYKLTAELPGFKTQIINDVQLGQGAVARYNFTMQVGAVADSVEVTAESTALISETAATIGQVLSEKKVQDLPLVSNNVLDLMNTMAGVRFQGLGEGTTFAGISTGLVNTVRDGLSVNDGRYANGVVSTTQIHPDMVGEFRVILTPVDAELGRGNGQVQILTRSGTNQFHGSGFWSIRNSALDANTWSNNKQVVNGVWSPGQSTWINRNQLTTSLGGPIIKNKTFFFVLFDKQFESERLTVRPTVLTDCARRGIFRYNEGWANGNTLTPTTTGGVPTRASVDSFGNPLYNDQTLHFFSVFGPVLNRPQQPDCSDAVIGTTPWDNNRTKLDPTGLIQKYLNVMPHANIFDGGDGLNTAIDQWTYRGHNAANFGLATGTSTDTNRKEINTKIDHNINAKNKVAFNYSYEWIDGDYLAAVATQWPGGYTSQVIRRPRVMTINFTSTISPSLLNEARYGYRSSQHVIWAPWETTDPKRNEVPLSYQLQGGNNFPIVFAPAAVGAMSANSYFCLSNCAQQGNKTPLTNIGDTVTLTRGKHAFKAGFDVRYSMTRGSETPTAPIPKALGGAGLNPNTAFTNATNFPGLVTTNQTTANSLLYFLAGSVGSASQYYFIQSPNDLSKWMSYVDRNRKINEPHQHEFSAFFKDDWKFRPNLTLNLGIRYDFYGVPFEGQGLSIRPVGGGLAMLGVSGRTLDKWLNPNDSLDPNLVTNLEFVGPKTSKADDTIYPNDWNNFGPAVGFAWSPEWFGKGKTNVRGGYQVSFVGGNHFGQLVNFIFAAPGFLNNAQTQGPTDGSYFDLRNLSGQIPITPSSLPMQPIPIQKQNQNIAAFDPNYVTPYVQNFTLSVTRELTRNLTLDVRYIGTKGIKLNGFYDLNTPNVFYNPTLMDALVRTRRGEDVLLFDQMFMGLNIASGLTGCNPANPSAACAAVNGTTIRGSQALRLSTTFRDALANGDFVTVANGLNTFNGTGPAVVTGAPGERGTVLKRANLGINVPGGTQIAGAPTVPAGLFPANWITANPQVAQANYYTNSGKSNYNSLQVQTTLRPTQGISFQGTYVWSRSLEVPLEGSNLANGLLTAPTYTNPADRNKDYALSAGHVTHDFRSNGVFELPFGPGHLFFRNSSGWAARAIGGWQVSSIINLTTGQPVSITSSYLNAGIASPTGMYGNSVPDVVGTFSSKNFGSVQWNDAKGAGNYFGTQFGQTKDPQCANVAPSLQGFCTLQAVTDAKTGAILLQNPQPGTRGTLGRQTLELPGTWNFDAAMSKTVKIKEGKTLMIRMDAVNILNHPNPSAPNLNINSSATPFGYIQTKTNDIRQFKGVLRLNF